MDIGHFAYGSDYPKKERLTTEFTEISIQGLTVVVILGLDPGIQSRRPSGLKRLDSR